MPGGGREDVDRFVDALEAAGDDLLRVVAVLWTWLERNLLTLGSLDEKAPAIRRAARAKPRLEGIDAATIAAIRKSPVRDAAELLARIDLTLATRGDPDDLTRRGGEPIVRVPGVDGEEVVVAVRRPPITTRHDDEDRQVPPAAIQHPSLSTFAPLVSVSPVVFNGIALSTELPTSPEWTAVLDSLEQAIGPEHSLTVHLDSLGEHGMSGWVANGDVGRFDPTGIEASDQLACAAAAREAVRQASGRPSVLVLPELAATPWVLEAIKDEIVVQGKASTPPALTVVGLYHREADDEPEIDDALLGTATVATHVNEAVVLGPGGDELWVHRKLSCAQGLPDSGDGQSADTPFVEDIRLGSTIAVVRTPIGMVAVVICLDSFADHVRDRLERSPADVLLVPSLSPSAKRHRDSLQQLTQRVWGMAFVCNRAPHRSEDGTGAWNKSTNRSFWAVQRRELRLPPECPKGAHPSFVFRLADQMDGKKSPNSSEAQV